jgi:signal peptidase I
VNRTNNGGQPGVNHPQERWGAHWLVTQLLGAAKVVLILLAIRMVAGPFYIPSGSMEPTLQVGDVLMAERISIYRGAIHRGDVLVFAAPEIETGVKDRQGPLGSIGHWAGMPRLSNETFFVKRVVGLPGDQISIRAGKGVYINGKLLNEPYIKAIPDYNLNVLGEIGGGNVAGSPIHPYGDPAHQKDAIVVPPGKLFMMGDNRNNSADSHVWGFLDENRVFGRAFVIFWRLL